MKRNRKTKMLISTVLCLIMILSLTQLVSAYALHTIGYYQKVVPINTTAGVLSTYTTAVNNAVSSWNSAGTPASITAGSSPYKNILYTQAVDDTWAGAYVVQSSNSTTYPKHSTTQFAIIINTNVTDSEGTNYKRSVGLADLVNGGNISVMSYNRDRNTIYTPQGDDKMGVAESWK